MNISVHTTGDVDTALALARAAGEPLGILTGQPVVDGDAIAVAFWPDTGPGRYRLILSRPGATGGPSTHMQVVTFDGPRSAQWAAAEQRAGNDRIWPAVRDIVGLNRILLLRADDNATLTVLLADGAAAIDEAVRAIMATSLLPGEDPALLTGPDRVAVYRLRQADLPADVALMGA